MAAAVQAVRFGVVDTREMASCSLKHGVSTGRVAAPSLRSKSVFSGARNMPAVRTAMSSSCRISAVPAAVRLARLVWNGKTNKSQIMAVASSLNVVVASAATAVEEAAEPAVTTETVPRPKKIGKGVVRLRLARFGRKKRPHYRIVATHHSRRRDGKYIELLGHYNPLHAKEDLGIVVKADRVKYWLGVGAQPSDTVTGILHKVGILKKVVPTQ